MFRRGARRDLHGVGVAILRSGSRDHERGLEKAAAAFELLAVYGVRSLEALRRHVDGVFIFGTIGALAEWDPVARLVVVDEEYVRAETTTAAHLASTLVHEATHARLTHLGFSYAAQRRARIEAVCFRRQLAFVRLLPEPGDMVAELGRQLARDPGYWTDEAFRQRTAAELVRLGVPGWLVRTFQRLSRQRAA